MASRSAEEELEALHDQSTAWLQRLLLDYFAAIYEGDAEEQARLEEALADAYATTMAFADMLGRRRVMREAREVMLREYYPEGLAEEQASERQFFAAQPVPSVPFAEALDDMLAREPMLASDFREVQQQYRDYHAFAAVRSTSQAMTAKVQQIIAGSLKDGTPDPAAAIQEATGWTRAYADTVYKTNVATAYSAGRLRQAADPDVQDVIVGLRFTAMGDSNTRKNHRAADGVIAAQDDPIWHDLAPPLGYNCRCGLELVDRFSVTKSMMQNGKLKPARVPAGAGRDPGFSQAPIQVEALPGRQIEGARPDVAYNESRTLPTKSPDPDARPRGAPKVASKKDTGNSVAYDQEYHAATLKARQGFDVVALPDKKGGAGGRPDLLVNGIHVHEVYGPEKINMGTLYDTLLRKRSRQSRRLILHTSQIEDMILGTYGSLNGYLQEVQEQVLKFLLVAELEVVWQDKLIRVV